MSSETPRHGPLVPVQRASNRESGSSSLVSVLWGLTGVVIGVVIGAAGVGENLLRHLPGDSRQVREAGELASRLGDLRHDLTARERELSAERQERKEAVNLLQAKLEASEWKSLAGALEGEFLDRSLAYEQTKSDLSRRQLVDTICGLRTQSNSARMMIVSAPLALNVEEIRRGLAPEVEQVLAHHGIPPDLLARTRRVSPAPPIPAVTPFNVSEVQRAVQARRFAMREEHEAIAALQRHVQKIRQVKAVKFSDGSEYAIPQEAARQMLSRRDCQSD